MTARFLRGLGVLASLSFVTIAPAAQADGDSSNATITGSSEGNSITLIGDQYERLDPAAGAGPGSSGGSGSGSSGGSSDVVVSFSVSKPGRVPLVCVAYAPDPNHLFCRPYEPEEPAPAVVPVVVSARDVASLMVDGSGITRQPPGTTARVDVDLIAYTDPSTRTLSTTVAGVAVEVEATPASYHWDWGDATTTTTTSPGAPWPHQTVTHRYHHPPARRPPHPDHHLDRPLPPPGRNLARRPGHRHNHPDIRHLQPSRHHNTPHRPRRTQTRTLKPNTPPRASNTA